LNKFNKYLLIAAKDKEDAISAVECLLDEWSRREFYEGYEVIEEETVPVSEIPDEFISNEKDRIQALLQSKRAEAETRRMAGKRFDEGWVLQVVSNILCEHFSEVMPWFNINDWSWQVPKVRDKYIQPEDEYWAVMVRFY
jgi:hypothetical protein